MELETRRKSGRRSLNGGQYRAVTVDLGDTPQPVLCDRGGAVLGNLI